MAVTLRAADRVASARGHFRTHHGTLVAMSPGSSWSRPESSRGYRRVGMFEDCWPRGEERWKYLR